MENAESKKPKISVIMPIFNSAPYLEDTLKTIINQSFSDWEIVVKDGGSKDNTVEILKKYSEKDPRIRYVSEPDEGPYDAIHKAARLAKGEFIANVCASDGYLNMDWLKMAAEAFDNDPEISLVWGVPFDMTEGGEVIGPNFIYAHYLPENSFRQRSGLIRNTLKQIDLRHPIKTAKRFIKKFNRNNLKAARSLVKKTAPPQKIDWFNYWLETGIIFPDGNMCLSRRVFIECLPPYNPGTREPGDWMGFYYNFNSKGYLARCIPVGANFGRLHGGSISEKHIRYNDDNKKEYHQKISKLREELKSKPMVFRDREGNVIDKK